MALELIYTSTWRDTKELTSPISMQNTIAKKEYFIAGMTVHSMVIFLDVAAVALGTLMDRMPCFRLALTLC